MVRTWCFHCRGPGSIPGQGTKILQACLELVKSSGTELRESRGEALGSIPLHTREVSLLVSDDPYFS